MRVAEAEADVVAEVLADGVGVAQLNLVALVLGLTEVAGSHGDTHRLRACLVFGQDVVATLVEVVEVTAQQAIEECEVNAEVELVGALPGDVVVGILVLEDTRLAGGAEVVVVHNLAPALFVEEALSGVVVVTHLTVAAANLQVVEPFLGLLHELLVADYPAERHGGEEAEALAAGKVLGAVVAEVELSQVAVVESIGDTTYDTLIALGQVGLEPIVVLVVEHHGGDVVLAELAGIVQLILHVELVRRGLVVACVAQLRVGVELVVRRLQQGLCRVDELVGGKGSRELTVVVGIVVERHHGACRQARGNPVHLVVGDEVGLADGVGGAVETGLGQPCHGVVLILRVAGIELLHGVAVIYLIADGEQPARRVVQSVEYLRVAAVEALVGVGTATVLETGAEVDAEREVLDQVEVEVGTESDTVVRLVRLVAVLVFREVLEQALLVVVFCRHVVAHALRAALDVDVVAHGGSRAAQHGVVPVNVGVEHGVGAAQLAVHAAAEHVDVVGRELRGQAVVGQCLFEQLHALVGVQVGVLARSHAPLPVGREADGRLLVLTALGGHQDDAVSTAHTIDGGGRGVLQHGDIFNVVGGYLREGTLDAIDHHQRLVVAGKRGASTDEQLHVVGTRGARCLRRHQTGHLTGQCLRHVARGRLQQLLGIHLADGANHTLFLLMAVAHDHHFLDHLAVFEQRHVHGLLSVHAYALAGEADVAEAQRGVGFHLQFEVAVEVGNRTVRRAGLQDAGSDDALTSLVGHLSADRYLLLG